MSVATHGPARMRFDLSVIKVPDHELEQQAISRLSENAHFRAHLNWLEFKCHEGCLYIYGRLPSYYLKQLLQAALREVPGVRSISNEVRVVSYTGLSSTA